MIRFKQAIRILLLSLTLVSVIQPSLVMAMQKQQPRALNNRADKNRNPLTKTEIAGVFAFLIITGIMLYLIKKIGFNPQNVNQALNGIPEQQIPPQNPIPQQPNNQPILQAEETCAICLESVQKLGLPQTYITTCCKKFICKNDADEMEKKAQKLYHNLKNPEWRQHYAQSSNFNGWPQEREHAACPVCRQYPLQMVKAHSAQTQIPLINQPQQPPQQACNICMDDKDKNNFATLSCKHTYCSDCLTHMVDAAIREKNTQQLRCPNQQCRQPINEQDIRTITHNNRNKLEAYQEITMQEWIAQQPNAKHCPIPNCTFAFINEQQNPQIIKCPRCSHEYCSECLLKHSNRISCREAKENHALSNDKNKAEKETEKWKQRHAKPCPRCTMNIQKIEGCDWIQCTKCKYEFCWACLGPRSHYGAHYCNMH